MNGKHYYDDPYQSRYQELHLGLFLLPGTSYDGLPVGQTIPPVKIMCYMKRVTKRGIETLIYMGVDNGALKDLLSSTKDRKYIYSSNRHKFQIFSC